MNNSALVSIILPTYNRAEILPRAIESVLRQTSQEWELIIVDDGSTDTTGALLQSYSQCDHRIISVSQNNSGPAASRNTGLRIANGYYTTYLDSDDEYLPDHLSLRIEFMLAHADVHFIHGGVIVSGTNKQQYVPDARDPSKMILIEDCLIGGTFFGFTQIFRDVGGWREGYSEDSELFKRIQSKYQTAGVHFQTYLYHRDRDDSRCNTLTRK